MNLEQLNSVATAHDDDIVLVGEDHDDDELFHEIAERAALKYQPRTVAIEAPRPTNSRSCAQGFAQEFASTNGLPLLGVDTNWRTYVDPGTDTSGIYSHINNVDTDEHGNYNDELRRRERQEVVDIYGQQVSDAVWKKRERDMAARLIWALDRGYPAPIMLACGYYHVAALKERLDDPEHPMEPLDDQRIRDPLNAQ